METRALCIAFFYAIGTAAGGIAGPLLFGWLIENASASGDITKIAIGYFIGAALMIVGGIVEAFLGVKAEGESLEDIATPLTAEDADPGPARLMSRPPSERAARWIRRPTLVRWSTTPAWAPRRLRRSGSTPSATWSGTRPAHPSTTPWRCARWSMRPPWPTTSAWTSSASESTTGPTSRSARPTCSSPRSPDGPGGSGSAPR